MSVNSNTNGETHKYICTRATSESFSLCLGAILSRRDAAEAVPETDPTASHYTLGLYGGGSTTRLTYVGDPVPLNNNITPAAYWT